MISNSIKLEKFFLKYEEKGCQLEELEKSYPQNPQTY